MIALILLFSISDCGEVSGVNNSEDGFDSDIGGTNNVTITKAMGETNLTGASQPLTTNLYTISLNESITSSGFGIDFDDRLARTGGQSGDIQISLIWNSYDDLDLHCIDPSAEEIYFGNKRSSSGGELDVDMNAGSANSNQPIENIFWPKRGAPRGNYKIYVKFYRKKSTLTKVAFKIAINIKGEIRKYDGVIELEGQKREITQFRIN